MRNKALLVLDFDGTLVDLGIRGELLRTNIQKLFEKYGVRSKFRPFLKDLEVAVEEITKQDQARGLKARDEAWAIIDEEEKNVALSAKACLGAHDFLTKVSAHPMAIYSNNCQEAVVAGLISAGINPKTFEEFFTRSLRQTLKPSGTPILAAFEKINPINKSEVFMLGDHVLDVQSALAAQTLFVQRGLQTKVVPLSLYHNQHHAEELKQAGSLHLFERLSEAIPLLNELDTP